LHSRHTAGWSCTYIWLLVSLPYFIPIRSWCNSGVYAEVSYWFFYIIEYINMCIVYLIQRYMPSQHLVQTLDCQPARFNVVTSFKTIPRLTSPSALCRYNVTNFSSGSNRYDHTVSLSLIWYPFRGLGKKGTCWGEEVGENRRGLARRTRPMTIGNRDFFRIFCQGGRSDISGWALPPLLPLSSSFTPPSPLPSLFPRGPSLFNGGTGINPENFWKSQMHVGAL
jgi:hypothetical protein